MAARRRATGSLRGLSVCVVGPGAVGTAFAAALLRAGAEVRLVGRTRGSAARARRRISGGRKAPRLSATDSAAGRKRALAGCDAVLVCVGDGEIERCARALAAVVDPDQRPGVALHSNGARGPEALRALADRGVACGVLHPLAPLPPVDPPAGSPNRAMNRAPSRARVDAGLRDGWFGVAGDPKARAVARRIARALSGRALALHDAPDASMTYHAAASLASGGVVALFDAALGAFGAVADDPAAARAALHSLMEKTLSNLGSRGAGEVLTGAAARGSAELVGEHLDAFDAADAEGVTDRASELYRELARRMVAIARDAGRLDARAARKVLVRLEQAARG